MGPNSQERQRAAERKAAADARQIISKAERIAGRRARKRKALIRDVVIAIIVALIVFGASRVVASLAGITIP